MYDIIVQEADIFKSFMVERMILNPNQWKAYPNRVPLTWHKIKFNSAGATNIPNTSFGIYSFIVIPEIANHPNCSYLLYVGMTNKQNFRQRYRQYLRNQNSPGKRPHINAMLNKWREHLWFCYAPIQQANIIRSIEDDLLAAYLPPFNKSFPANVREPMKVLR